MNDPQWKAVDTLAAELGVSAEARRKWRERDTVPHRWRLPILQRAAGRFEITAETFERTSRRRRAA
jgi:hypothetical protein